MRTTSVDVIQRRGERAQLRPWRGDPATAHLAPVPGGAPLTAAFVDHCASRAALAGYRRIVSGALNPSEQGGFAQAGFTAIEELHLLSHDLVEVAAPSPAGLPLRRGRADDRTAVLAVDALAFPPFWQLDDRGIEDAVEATPAARYRVAVDGDVPIGYAITGRAGRRGYVQRLAVHPDRQRRGVGRDLVIDGLRWLRRWRVAKALVNTQVENTGAVALYTSLGFRLEPAGLSVFGRDL